MPFLLVALLVSWGIWDSNFFVVWVERYAILSLAGVLFFSYLVSKQVSKSLGVLLFVVLLSAVRIGLSFSLYKDQPFEVQAALRQSASEGALSLLLLVLFVMFLKEQTVRAFIKILGIFGLICGFSVILTPLFGLDPKLRVLFLINPSMAGSFIACALPLFYLTHREWMLGQEKKGGVVSNFFILVPLLICGVAIVMTGASSALLALAVILGISWMLLFRSYPRAMGAVALLAISYLFIFWVSGSDVLEPLLNSTGRFDAWRIAYKNFTASSFHTWIFGYGLGSTRVLMPLFQVDNGMNIADGKWFLWLHSDWLQIIFELGLLGIGAGLVFFATLVKAARREPLLLMSACAFASTMLTNFPLHSGLHSLLGAIIVRAVMKPGWRE
jgi:hypothetical protein